MLRTLRALGATTFPATICAHCGNLARSRGRSPCYDVGAGTSPPRRWPSYRIFVLFPLPRFCTAPHFHGYRAWVYIGVLGSVCQEIILFVVAVVVWKSLSGRDSRSHRAALIARWTFWLCAGRFRPWTMKRLRRSSHYRNNGRTRMLIRERSAHTARNACARAG